MIPFRFFLDEANVLATYPAAQSAHDHAGRLMSKRKKGESYFAKKDTRGRWGVYGQRLNKTGDWEHIAPERSH